MGRRRRDRGGKHVVIPGWGDPCPKCCQPTEIREHTEVTAKHLRQPYYYSRWYYCQNPNCKVTTHMAPRHRIFSDAYRTREAVELERQGRFVWGRRGRNRQIRRQPARLRSTSCF
jgi:hypothetical protein